MGGAGGFHGKGASLRPGERPATGACWTLSGQGSRLERLDMTRGTDYHQR